MTQPAVLLVDNGSTRAQATISLRRIAAQLGAASGRTVYPVSLKHADRVPAAALGGQPAEVFTPFLRRQLKAGQRHFVVVPQFFGGSRALTSFIPEQTALLRAELGALQIDQAAELCPLPQGEPLLADILADHVRQCAAQPARVILVDHGSPIPQVTAVREWLASALTARLPAAVEVDQAVMERREGRVYDFNGQLLEERLQGARGEIVLAMLFISPGRHAGEGGDIAEICAAAERTNRGLKVTPSPLVGEHPKLVEILQQRLEAAINSPVALA